jgi:hypothetical protein
MIDPKGQGSANGGFQVGLVVRGNFCGRNVLPFVLVTHSTAGKDWNLQFGSSKTSVFHGGYHFKL